VCFKEVHSLATVYVFETEKALWSMNCASPLTRLPLYPSCQQLASNLVIFIDINTVGKPITSTKFWSKDHLILC